MKRIAIITDAGPILGTGHLERMVLFADFLDREETCEVTLLTPADLPPELEGLRSDTLPGSTDFIIRDMRDSTKSEIAELQKTAPVLVIDDAGEGRTQADYRINLLPPPPEKNMADEYRPSFFLYGYHFARSLESLKKDEISRSLDLLIYPGYQPTAALLNKFSHLVPAGFSAGFFYNNTFHPITDSGPGDQPVQDFGSLLHASRMLLTHFGISLYEGRAAGCSLAVIDPTSYHNSLTRQLDWQNLSNLGTWEAVEINRAKRSIKAAAALSDNSPGKPKETEKDIKGKCRQFYRYICEEMKN